jgi:hypothetical protein
MRRILLTLLIFILIGNNISYGQTIVTDDNNNPIEGFGLVKDPNSNTIYFGKTDSISSTAIYRGILSGGKINSIRKNYIIDSISQETMPFFSSDGKYIFLFSNFENQSSANLDLWFGEYNKGVIRNLKKAAAVNTDSVEYYGSISADGYIYFSSWRSNSYGKGDIYSTKFKKGKFSSVNHLDDNINNKFINSSPAISPKGDWFVFFNATEDGADLYISFLKKERWSKPVKLADVVNTSNFEFAPVVSDNGKTLFFSRREKSILSDKQVYHIYEISIDELGLENLRLRAEY